MIITRLHLSLDEGWVSREDKQSHNVPCFIIGSGQNKNYLPCFMSISFRIYVRTCVLVTGVRSMKLERWKIYREQELFKVQRCNPRLVRLVNQLPSTTQAHMPDNPLLVSLSVSVHSVFMCRFVNSSEKYLHSRCI